MNKRSPVGRRRQALERLSPGPARTVHAGLGVTVLLGAWLAFSCASKPPVPPGSVSGVAIDTSGNVLPGITVSLESPAGKPVETVFTSEDGSYSFPQVPPGKYRVLTFFAGFSTQKPLDVTVGSGMSIRLQPLVLLLPDQTAPTPVPR